MVRGLGPLALCWSCWGSYTLRCWHLVCLFVSRELWDTGIHVDVPARGLCWPAWVPFSPRATSLRELRCPQGRGCWRLGAGRQLSASPAGPERLRLVSCFRALQPRLRSWAGLGQSS